MQHKSVKRDIFLAHRRLKMKNDERTFQIGSAESLQRIP
jgi:hypothetical protein